MTVASCPAVIPTVRRDDLAAAALVKLAAGTVRIPGYPAVVARLRQLTADERAGTSRIVGVVASDPVLAALVLARASAAAGGVGPMTSIDTAVYRLGGNELVQLALTASLGAATAGPGVLASLRHRAWRDALVSAGICEALAFRRHLARDQAYTAGLLHDFGAIVALACLEAVAASRPVAMRSDADWWSIVDRIHVTAGAEVATAWRLAPEIAEVIVEHHSPTAVISPNPLVRLVATVDTVMAALVPSGMGAALPAVPAAQLQGIQGLEPGEDAVIAAALPQIVQMIGGFETVLQPVAAALAAPTLVVRPRGSIADGWPVTATVDNRVGSYTAHRIWLDSIGFRGPVALRPDWLTQLVIDDGNERVDVLANIKRCDPAPGGYEIVGAPYALAGDAAVKWRKILDRARR